MRKVNAEDIQQALDWAYEKVLEGPLGLGSPGDLARDYQRLDASPLENANSLIRRQKKTAATIGFVTGIGGLITLPVTVPANISSVLFVQVRMIAAIAIMGGHDVHDDRVKTLVYTCLVKNALKEASSELLKEVAGKLTISAIKSVPRELLVAINRAVGFRLLTKFGEKGVINLHKAVPLVGGLIGATIDAVDTDRVGKKARKTFIENPAAQNPSSPPREDAREAQKDGRQPVPTVDDEDTAEQEWPPYRRRSEAGGGLPP